MSCLQQLDVLKANSWTAKTYMYPTNSLSEICITIEAVLLKPYEYTCEACFRMGTHSSKLNTGNWAKSRGWPLL